MADGQFTIDQKGYAIIGGSSYSSKDDDRKEKPALANSIKEQIKKYGKERYDKKRVPGGVVNVCMMHVGCVCEAKECKAY